MTEPARRWRIQEYVHELLSWYGFVRSKHQDMTLYRRASGPFRIWLHLMDDGKHRLVLGYGRIGQCHAASSRPWSYRMPAEPIPMALEAARFIAVVEGLTPPECVGRFSLVGSDHQEGLEESLWPATTRSA